MNLRTVTALLATVCVLASACGSDLGAAEPAPFALYDRPDLSGPSKLIFFNGIIEIEGPCVYAGDGSGEPENRALLVLPEQHTVWYPEVEVFVIGGIEFRDGDIVEGPSGGQPFSDFDLETSKVTQLWDPECEAAALRYIRSLWIGRAE